MNIRRVSMQDEVLIECDGVSKKFCRSLKRSLSYGVIDMAREMIGAVGVHHTLRKDEFWAVQDVSFQVRRGECLGLLGHNGAGKTTLLRMLNGLIKPDRGRITMRGRVGALIALGAGFNPILSGRENIYVNAAVLGLSKRETDERIEEIIEFAEIGDFIDSPVQSYSSGMQVRLGFAAATSLRPDVLILDEVLAVGDAAFRAKCFKRIGIMAGRSAIIFVSHDPSQVSRICDAAMLLDKGIRVFLGETAKALSTYSRLRPPVEHNSTVQLDEDVSEWKLHIGQESPNKRYHAGTPLTIDVTFITRRLIPTGVCFVTFVTEGGLPGGQIDLTQHITHIPVGAHRLTIRLPGLDLAEGTYSVNFALFGATRTQTVVHAVGCTSLRVTGDSFFWSAYKIPVEAVVWYPSIAGIEH